MIWWLLIGPLMAQPALTVEEAVAMALKNHPDASAVRAARLVSSAQVEATRALPQPEVRMSFNNFGIDPETLEGRTNVGLRWSPPRPREMGLKKQVAQARQSGVEASVRGFEATLAAETRMAFRRAAIAAERVRVAEQAAALRGKVLDVVKRQVAAGLKEATDADLAELTVADAEVELRRVRAAAAAEKRVLLRWMAVDSDFALVSESGLLEAPEAVALRSEPLTMRAELLQAASACKESELLASLAHNQRYPWISFTQVTRRVSAIENRGPWSFQFGVDLPLFRTSAKAEWKIAEAQGVRCRAQQRALESQVRNEVAEAVAALEAARLELIELDRVRVGAAARALDRTRMALENGRADQMDVLLAEVRTVALRERWLERRMEYAQLEARLEQAVGGIQR